MPATKLTAVLEDAEASLKNAELKGLVGKFIFNPFCENILVPVSSKATEIIPAVAECVPLPYVDEVSSTFLGFGVGAVKVGYSILPITADDNIDTESDGLLENELRLMKKKGKASLKPKPLLSSLMGVIGFASNSVIDLVRLPFSGDLGAWIDTSEKFVGYLTSSGVGGELLDAFFSPGVVDAIIIIAKVQDEKNNTKESRRIRTAMNSLPETIPDQSGFKSIIVDAMIYSKYSSAAYGVSMIDSAELLQVYGKKVGTVPLLQGTSEDKRKRKIARYLNIPEEDIIGATKPGGDIDILGHFIAVDKRKSAVVLALRGTYTLSGVKSDLGVYSKKFCNGVAHGGIADRTDNIWEFVKEKIVSLLKSNPGFDFVITGHSLGAGAAALLILKLKHEQLLAKLDPSLSDVNIKCFAFAPPPVYLSDVENENVMADAMKNTFAFIHENDCVPFCSTDSVRRVSRTIDAVDSATNPIEGPLMAIGKCEIPDSLKKKVFDDSELPFADRAEKLAIPAPHVMWLRHVHDDKKGRPMYNAMFCRPQSENGEKGTNDLTLMIDKRMISDHMNPQYERAINSIAEQMKGKHGIDGFVFPPSTENV